MTDFKDIITLTVNNKYEIFNTPEVDEKMKPILTRLESLILYLHGKSMWSMFRYYEFYIKWNVVCGKPYVSKILATKYLKYNDIAVKMTFRFVNHKVELTLTQPVQVEEVYVDKEITDEKEKIQICDEYLKKIELGVYEKENKILKLDIQFLRPSLSVREYYEMPNQIQKMCNVLYETLLKTDKEVLNVEWFMSDCGDKSTLQLNRIETKEFTLEHKCTQIIIPNQNIKASFGCYGDNKNLGYKYLQQSYNHIGTLQAGTCSIYSREPNEQEMNDIYNMVITWLNSATKK